MLVRLTHLLFAILLINIGIFSFYLAHHEFQGHIIWREVKSWDDTRVANNESNLQSYSATAEFLAKKHTWHSEFSFLTAKLYEWFAFWQRLSPTDTSEQRKLARQYLELTVERRPFWGRPRAALLLQKDPEDKDSELHLVRVLQLGRYDHEVQYYLIRYAFRYWTRLPKSSKVSLLEFLETVIEKRGLGREYIKGIIRNNPLSPLSIQTAHLLR